MNWKKQSGNHTEQYQLSAREQALIARGYDEKIILELNHFNDDTLDRIATQVFDYIVRDCTRTDTPKALYIGGQPGSGKSVVVRNLKRQTDYEDFASLCIDNYRTWHPQYERIEEEIRRHWENRVPTENETPGNDMADFTHAFSSDLIDLLIAELSVPVNGKYYSMCIEWGMRTPQQPLECMRILKEKGYQNEVLFLCVPAEVSLKSCTYRDAYMNSGSHIFRRVPESFHSLCVDTIAESCEAIYTEGVCRFGFVDVFRLIDRDQKVIWQSGETDRPGDVMSRILSIHGQDAEISMNEAQKSYYNESVGLFRRNSPL